MGNNHIKIVVQFLSLLAIFAAPTKTIINKIEIISKGNKYLLIKFIPIFLIVLSETKITFSFAFVAIIQPKFSKSI